MGPQHFMKVLDNTSFSEAIGSPGYRDLPATDLMSEQDAHQHVELIKANLPGGVPVQQVKHQHDLPPCQVSHIVEKVIKLQIWKTGGCEAQSAQSC